MTGEREVAVLMACYNRRDVTLDCLHRLEAQAGLDGTRWRIFLVDDASSDGTAAAVAAAFPSVQVIQGTGDLFWGGGMHLAWTAAQESLPSADYFLLLNDDTHLHDDALEVMFDLAGRCPDTIVVAAIADPERGELNYGGFVQPSRLFRLKFERRRIDDQRPATAMNGNCVLVPMAVVDSVGLLDPAFRHRFGDLDYGLRATAKGHGIQVTRQILGTCRDNPHDDVRADVLSMNLRDWLRHLVSNKGLPAPDWMRFARRHGGVIWPVSFVGAYVVGAGRWAIARRPRKSSLG